MKELIKISENENGKAVSARELYEALGFASQHYSKWYKKNILSNDFAVENEDYIQLPLSGRSKNFALTIDFAKRIAMMAKTEKGEEIRSYFIECEKKAQSQVVNLSRMDILKMAMESEEQLQLANTTIQEQAPKVEYTNKVLDSTTSYSTTLIAKELGMSATKLNRILKEMKVQYKQDGAWVLYSKYQSKGYTDTKTVVFYN